MAAPTLQDLPSPSPDKTGWPWTKQSDSLPAIQSNGSSWPKISIVTPSYNQGQFIEETIRSVLLQGYPNLEYLVIDGGSDDQTIGILEKYDPWIDYWVSESDRGQAHAINKGLKRASGEIHGWLNSDDLFVRNALGEVASVFIAQGCDALSGGRLLIDEDSNVTGWSIPRSKNPEEGGNPWAQDSTLWRSYVYDKIGYLDESYDFAMDYEFFLRVNSRFNIKDVNNLIGGFRCYPNNKSSTKFESIGKKETEKAQKKHISKLVKSKRSTSIIRHWAFWFMNPRRLAIPYILYKIK